MDDPVTQPLRRKYDELLERLNSEAAGGDRESLKKEIISLFTIVDQAITGLTKLKEDIRVLVDKYKELSQVDEGSSAPRFTGAMPLVHQDHIGASTFIEKGWRSIWIL